MNVRAGVVVLLVLAGCPTPKAPPAPLQVAAAADLQGTLEAIAQAHERETGQPVALTFGASGLLARQLEQGAPFEVFLAADRSFAEQASKAPQCDPASLAPYAKGRLAVWRPKGVAGIESFEALSDERLGRIAIANPETAPYGRAAKEALEKAGLWTAVEPRLVLGENVRQAFQITKTGNAGAAVVSLSLARSEPGEVLEVPASLHTPLVQTLVLCGPGDRTGAKAFAARVRSAKTQAALEAAGFAKP